MSDGSRLFNQALVVLRDCLGLQRSEEVLILWDGTVSEELVAASRYAALALGARPLLLSFHPAGYRPMREYGLFAGASRFKEPPNFPRGVLGAMAACDRIVFATSDMSVFFFSPEVREIMRKCPAVRLTYQTTDAALRLLPESSEEVRALAELTRRLGQLVTKARRARVTSTAGTDITMALGQHQQVSVSDGVAGPGRQQALPGGQVSGIPNDGSAEGVLTIDRSIGANDFKELTETVIMKVDKGNVTSISGGGAADRLRRFMEGLKDPNIYHVTELGIGTNRRCRFSGVAAPGEDTHTSGTVSLALGCDTHLGGVVPAPAHIDMTMHVPTLELDGELVVQEGKLLVS